MHPLKLADQPGKLLIDGPQSLSVDGQPAAFLLHLEGHLMHGVKTLDKHVGVCLRAGHGASSASSWWDRAGPWPGRNSDPLRDRGARRGSLLAFTLLPAHFRRSRRMAARMQPVEKPITATMMAVSLTAGL